MRSWLIALIGTVICVVSLGLLAAPAGAQTASTTTVTDNAPLVVTGGTLVFTATVAGTGGPPAGSVAWTGSTCSSTTDLSAGAATCSINNALAGTSYSETASFTDSDGNYTDSGGSDGPVSPAPAASMTVVTDNAPGVVTGGTLVFTATVSGPGGTPAGSVGWTGSACSSTTALSAGVATCSISDAQAGTSYSETASFTDSDGNYSASSGFDTGVSVGTAASMTAVTNNAVGVMTGGTLVFTATVSGPGGTPAGSVEWTGSPCSSTTALSAGVATCSISDALAGTSYSETANFTDSDGNYSASSGSESGVTVGKAASTTIVSDNAAGLVTGGTLVFTATVSGPGGTPTGLVVWTGSPCSSATALSAGVATCSISGVRASTSYSETASFTDSDGNYSNSSGSESGVTVGKAASTTIVSDNAAGVLTGSSFTFTATVSGPGVTPTGLLTWSVADPLGHAVLCPPSALDGGGSGTCTIPATIAGAYSATASYGGDSNYGVSSGLHTSAKVYSAPSVPTISNIPSSPVFGGHFVAAVSTTGDGLKSVASGTPGVCTVGGDGLTVSFVAPGTCSLTPGVAQGSTYIGATGGARAFGVGRATPSTPVVTDIPGNAVEFAGFDAVVGTNGDGTTYVVSSTPGLAPSALTG